MLALAKEATKKNLEGSICNGVHVSRKYHTHSFYNTHAGLSDAREHHVWMCGLGVGMPSGICKVQDDHAGNGTYSLEPNTWGILAEEFNSQISCLSALLVEPCAEQPAYNCRCRVASDSQVV